MAIGLFVARGLIGDDYGYDSINGRQHGGPHDQIIFVCFLALAGVYAARRGFMWAAYYSVVADYNRSLDTLPEPERTSRREDYYRRFYSSGN